MTIVDICQELGLQPQFLLELSKNASSLYTVFDHLKRSGGVRTISAPKDALKRIQRLVLEGFLSKVYLPPHVHGCVKGKSIVTNAQAHVGQPLVINIDIVDFFGSIKFDRVLEIYRTYFNCDDEAAEVLTCLTTFGNFLPQGAPTSPVLANVAALELDEDLIRICQDKGNKFHYTRYVDDITISGGIALADILEDLYAAVEKNGFTANRKKLKLSKPSARQKVTGIVVNEKISAPKKLIRKQRQLLYYCNKFGLDDHCKRKDIEIKRFIQETKGWIGYIGMTRPELASEFSILLHRSRQKLIQLPPNPESITLRRLTNIISIERLATFKYEDSSHRVAPAEITVDDDGRKILRAFELSPEQAWKTFLISKITELKMEGVRP